MAPRIVPAPEQTVSHRPERHAPARKNATTGIAHKYQALCIQTEKLMPMLVRIIFSQDGRSLFGLDQAKNIAIRMASFNKKGRPCVRRLPSNEGRVRNTVNNASSQASGRRSHGSGAIKIRSNKLAIEKLTSASLLKPAYWCSSFSSHSQPGLWS